MSRAGMRPPLMLLWTALAIPALTAAAHHWLQFLLVDWVCRTQVRWVQWAVTGVALLIAAAGIALAGRDHRLAGNRELPRFMAIGAIALGCLFALLILVQGVATLLLPPCA
jgi:hypothetical protein